MGVVRRYYSLVGQKYLLSWAVYRREKYVLCISRTFCEHEEFDYGVMLCNDFINKLHGITLQSL